ncbi:hypothetical protein GOBAR_AA35494 [Gossypium barbadense]|uniref:1,3-beta-glucan synthase n=1 Tax=Gossypium barbadense TaxID=3634 RepID=A0A2P5W2B2_GOSBA|nr:hypothetical protein GOBAR_AA35494 [Gossypium barbadense]
MSNEIVPVDDPIEEPKPNKKPVVYDEDEGSKGVVNSLTYYGESSSSGSGGYVPEVFNSESLPSTLASEIQRFLRVANMLEWKAARVAYLCRFHAFEIAHNLDRNSTGRKVRQFKTMLLQRLERDEETSKTKRKEQSDSRELKRVYDENRRYISQHAEAFDLENSHGEKLLDACRIASVLYDVLKAVIAGPQALADRESIQARTELFAYNILPLDHGGIQQAIMKFPELEKLVNFAVNFNISIYIHVDMWLQGIDCSQTKELLQIKVAIQVIRNVRGLPSTQNLPKRGTFIDCFEFLQYSFGFQKENVANQREHLVLLLANVLSRHSRKQALALKTIDASIDELMRKFFKNYTNWCKFLVRKSNIRLPCVKQDAQQYKILYIGLYLLIWGEAANLRFMPECLCYIFHHMAYELHGMLTGAVSMTTGDTVEPAYGGSHESFLSNVVTPIYEVIRKEAEKNKCGTADHTTWRNYDDLNEFFWSPDCFQIGWPMRLEHDFFCTSSPKKSKVKTSRSAREQRKEKEAEDEEQGLNDPRLYVGRGMQETQISLFKYDLCSRCEVQYTFFWMLVLSTKLVFSYSFEMNSVNIGRSSISQTVACNSMIKPLIAPTREIMKIGVQTYDWHELFPKVRSNVGAIVAVWAPIIVVYFMDTQIWYSVYCTVCGGLYGILHHLGEVSKSEVLDQKFVLVWNQIISNFRSEDLISNREMDLMTIPTSGLFPEFIRWPIFLLANKFSTALSIARDFVGKDEKLFKRIRKDEYMYFSVKECYESVRYILEVLIVGDLEKRVVSNIVNEIERSIEESTFLQDFKMSALPALQNKFVELLELIVEGDKNQNGKVVQVLQDIFELVTNDMMANGHRVVDLIECSQEAVDDFTFFSRKREPQLFESAASKTSICFPLPDDGPLTEQIQRLHLLLTVKDKAMDMPANLEARRRISFFATSLFMDMPSAPESLGYLTLIDDSLQNFRTEAQVEPNLGYHATYHAKLIECYDPPLYGGCQFFNEGATIKQRTSFYHLLYAKNLPEWKNFLERMGYQNFNELIDDEKEEEIRKWASFRGQTLSRTVRGIMYYRQALKLQALLEMPEYKAFIAFIFFLVATCAYPDVVQDVNVFERNNPKSSAELDALVDMKFTYVVSCQMFGSHKSSGDPRAEDVKDLMIRYPALRVAYIEEKEEIIGDKPQKVYSSILAKAVGTFDQVIYRIKLPGPPIIGEGKPENQNHAIIFTRGEALQTIDMNQDNYLEEALKVRNLLQEFHHNRGRRPPTILGLREHIFTGSVSSLAWFMSYQETSFVTIGQRLLANPLRVRFHYGHPDVFDRLFHMTRGGISKASKTINLSEDVFAGFNSTLRRGCITYHEYLQVGKGRDVGLNQISKFEAKVANGNSEQTLSRDIHRLGRRFDFFRMLSCYFTTIGFYFSSLISVLGIYVFLYGQLYLVLSGLEKALLIEARMKNIESLETALASQSFIQLGLLTGLPMVMEIGLEKGFLTALKDFVLMQLQLAAVFFTFSLGTKTHHFGRTIMYGGAKYIPTGRKVVVFHASFTENYRLYSRSHFVKGFELLLLLVVYDLFRRSYQSSMAYVLITYSVWFMTMTWLFAPFFFNPSGFDWDKIVDDWKGWNKWIKEKGGIGIQQNKSWQSWWNDEQAHLRRSGYGARLFEILLSIRFFLYQYGLVYHLDISQQSKNFLVYVLSWVVILAVFLTVKAVNIGRQLFSARYHLMFRFFKAFLFLSVFTIVITLSVICELSSKDLLVCCLAFLPTGWGLILVAQAVRPIIENTGLWQFTEVLAKAYDYGMGSILFSPIAILAWLPIISAFQTRFLFNQAFNRHLQIQPILEGKKKQK